MCQESLDHERARHKHTEKSMECIWNSHNKLGEIMSRVEYEMDSNIQSIPRMRYNITELVLELSSKSQRIDKLETTLEQARQEHKDEVQHLRHVIHAESEQHTEDSMNQSQQIHHLDILLQQARMKGLTMEGNIEPSQDPKPARRRRRFRGKMRAIRGETPNHPEYRDSVDEAADNERADDLPLIKEESL